jgi:hypothetical protein
MITEPPQWDESRDAWMTQVRTSAFGWIELMIRTDGSCSPPTDRQLSAVEWIANLPRAATADISRQARSYAEAYMMEDDYEELSDADFEIRFSTCLIPRLRDTTDHYCFMIGASDIDDEHGVACLFKNDESCRVCHTDVAYENYGWDDIGLLDSILRS